MTHQDVDSDGGAYHTLAGQVNVDSHYSHHSRYCGTFVLKIAETDGSVSCKIPVDFSFAQLTVGDNDLPSGLVVKG